MRPKLRPGTARVPRSTPLGGQHVQVASSGGLLGREGLGHQHRGHQRRGMVSGMATKKVTITLDEVQLDRIRSLVQSRTAPSVSGFVQHAVAVALDDVAGWGAMLAEALRESGGTLSDDERAWADDILGTSTRPGRSAA